MRYNNSNQLKRLYNRFSSYIIISKDFLSKDVPVLEVIKTKFPYYLKDNKKPISLSIEMGNVCNLECSYCNVPHYTDKKEFMSENIFDKLIENLKKEKINRVRIGGGEPTLHPQFDYFVSEIRKHTKYLSIVTNCQWNQSSIVETLIKTPFDLIEVSMDAGGEDIYESSRRGAKYHLFESNLTYLKSLKDKSKSKTLINMRLMVRPSTQAIIKEEKKKWDKYCDSIMPQFIFKLPETEYNEDIFIPIQRMNNAIPKCTLPFKDILLKLNGEMPYCQVTGSTIAKDKIIAGHILNETILSVWTSKVKQMRNAHRTRHFESYETKYCNGCSGR